MIHLSSTLVRSLAVFLSALGPAAFAADGASGPASAEPARSWSVGEPIVTYWCGPPLTDAVLRQMVEGGFNLVWCRESDLDLAARHGVRAHLTDGLLAPESLETPEGTARLDALIERVRRHPALYSYHIVDEPSAAQFPALGKLVAHIRERDPAHLAYINLFPTYASNEQLGTTGDVVTAYREHLRLYVETVRPALLSYDHYQFMKDGDTEQYFLNLSLIRRAAFDAGVPFLNIVQASSWAPNVRVPNADELRYLVSTTAAYGAQGVSTYIYCCPNHEGGIAHPDGTPTPLYHALKSYSREFVAIVKALRPLRSLGVHHTALAEPGCEPLPADAPFRIASSSGRASDRGFLLGLFGADDRPTHVLAVNLDYRAEAVATVAGPGPLESFDALSGEWSGSGRPEVEVRLPPGGGKLLRVARSARPKGPVAVYEGEYPGWPWIARGKDGTLFCVFREGTEHDFSPVGRAIFSRSRDGGLSWSAPKVILDVPGVDDRNVAITELPGGDLLAVLNTYTAARESLAVSVRSTDGGDTWSAPAPIGPENTRTRSAAVVLSDGALLLPFYVAPGNGSLAARSEDGGRTWTVARVADAEGFVGDEWDVLEVSPGRLIGAIRNSHPRTDGHFWVTESVDGGRSWSVPRKSNVQSARAPSPPHLCLEGKTPTLIYADRRMVSVSAVKTADPEFLRWDVERRLSCYEYESDGSPILDGSYPASVQVGPHERLIVDYEIRPASRRISGRFVTFPEDW